MCKCHNPTNILKSRSEQAPGSVFHHRDKSGKIDYDFLRTFCFNIKVDLERQVPYGPYKLLVSHVVHQMKEKIKFQQVKTTSRNKF